MPRTLLDTTGTDFVYEQNASSQPSAFHARVPGSGDIDFVPLVDVLESERPAQAERNAKALHAIALAVLSEPRVSDPNVRYAKQVHQTVLETLQAAGRISTADIDELTMAIDIAVEVFRERGRGRVAAREGLDPGAASVGE